VKNTYMLTVYTTCVRRPAHMMDLSTLPLDRLVDAALAIYAHQTSVEIWFGYLDGWMLTPHEEVLLRKVIRKFECALVSAFPLSLSQSWKNEIRTVYTKDPNGASQSHHDGGAIHYGRSP
jgi:hypothetical protein